MNTLKNLVKIVVAMAIVGGTIAIAAAGEISKKNVIIRKWSENMFKGFEKGLELRGRTLTTTEKRLVQEEIGKSAVKIADIVEHDGLLEEYYQHLTDPELEEINEEVLRAKTIVEVRQLFIKQMSFLSQKHPKVYDWAFSSSEAKNVISDMMLNLSLTLNHTSR